MVKRSRYNIDLLPKSDIRKGINRSSKIRFIYRRVKSPIIKKFNLPEVDSILYYHKMGRILESFIIS